MELRSLRLQLNDFSGELPSSTISTLVKLTELRISGNRGMTGPFPSVEPMASTLRVLDAALCNWEGPLPAGLTACVGLVHLSLMDNHFDGPIPQSWAAQKELVEINMVRRGVGCVCQFQMFNREREHERA